MDERSKEEEALAAKSIVQFAYYRQPDVPPAEHLVRKRNEVLFGGKPVRDPLVSQGTRFDNWHTSFDAAAPRFELNVREFLEKARALRPHKPSATASAFSQWVYSLYGTGFGDEEDRSAGKEAERRVWERRRQSFIKATTTINQSLIDEVKPGWRLAHKGLDLTESSSGWFSIPTLRVNGEALRASPDLMFINDDDKEVLIVEIKNTRMAVPPNLWPNIWAQLWCYAQIDAVMRSKQVTVVGEIWGNMWPELSSYPTLFLRASVRRDPRIRAYDSFFRELFSIFSGTS